VQIVEAAIQQITRAAMSFKKNTKARPSSATQSHLISKNSFQLKSTDFPSLPKSSYSNIAASVSSEWGSSSRANNTSSASLPQKTTTSTDVNQPTDSA
jgi:hypothetical protein